MTMADTHFSVPQLNADVLQRSRRRAGFAFVGLSLPAFVLVMLVLIVPFTWLAWMSFYDASGALSAENYARLMRPAYVDSFLTTFKVASIVTIVCVILGYPVAYLLSQLPEKAAQVMMIFIILPFWTSVLVRTYAWLVLLQRQGLINTWLTNRGVISEPLPLVNNPTGTVIGMVHVMLPFPILPLYASMKTIDPILLRAASNCGASPAQAFRQVFLPLSLPGVATGVAMIFVLCLGYYLTPALLGGGRVAMWSTQIADMIAKFANWGAASALSVVLLIVTGTILWIVNALLNAASVTKGCA